MSDPILREKTIGTRRIQARGGLHFIRGNKLPHFSLTIASWEGRREDTFGAAHDELVKLWPSLKPLAALHLSDIDGVPMHAEANGWYWLAGAAGPTVGAAIDGGHLGQKYHGSNSERQHWNPDGSFDGYRNSTPDECLATFAEHVRTDVETARQLLKRVRSAHYDDPAVGRRRFAEWIKEQKPRWKAEAVACIEALGLQVYGDRWEREAVAA